MKLYATTVQTGANSYKTLWGGSLSEASGHRMQLRADRGEQSDGTPADKPTTNVHDVPTTKVELITWLNAFERNKQ